MPAPEMIAAIRAATVATLWEAAGDAYVSGLSAHARTALTDDLCRCTSTMQTAQVNQVDLARVAADSSESVARLARALYGTRLLLGVARLDAAATKAGEAMWPMPEAPGRIQPAPDLSSALETLQNQGLESACTSRTVVEALGSQASGGAVARVLRAAHSGDAKALIAALTADPFHIEAGEIALALWDIAPVADVRETLAVAIGSLSGGPSREAAVAALDALTAATRAGDDSQSLAQTVRAVESALREFACTRGEYFADAHYPELIEAAAQADIVWDAAARPVPPAIRIASLLDGVAVAHTQAGVTLRPNDGRAARAQIVFDNGGASLTWQMLAAALGQPDVRDAPQLCVRIAADADTAVANYLAHSAQERTPNEGYRWPGPQEQLAFTAPPMTFSASRLNAYVKCPRRWFFDYLCQVLEDPSSLQAAYGSVIHDALESLHRAVRVPGRHDPGIVLERLLKELDIAFGNAREAFASQLEYEVSRARARRIAEHYVRWLAAETAREPMTVEQVEVMQRLTLGGHEFVGYIDRIDRPLAGGPVTILDYKTGRIETDAAAYLDKMRRGDEAQLALYYAMRTAAGDDVKRIALVSVRDPRDEVWIMALDIGEDERRIDERREDGMIRARISPADLQTSLAALVSRCDTLTKDGQTHFGPGADPPCGYCAYKGACRERPADGERIFAR